MPPVPGQCFAPVRLLPDQPIELGGTSHRIGAGIGIALLPADAITPDEHCVRPLLHCTGQSASAAPRCGSARRAWMRRFASARRWKTRCAGRCARVRSNRRSCRLSGIDARSRRLRDDPAMDRSRRCQHLAPAVHTARRRSVARGLHRRVHLAGRRATGRRYLPEPVATNYCLRGSSGCSVTRACRPIGLNWKSPKARWSRISSAPVPPWAPCAPRPCGSSSTNFGTGYLLVSLDIAFRSR